MQDSQQDPQTSAAAGTSGFNWDIAIPVGIAVLVVAVAVVAYLLWRRKNARQGGESAAVPLGVRLTKIWHELMARLPLEASHYPTVIVLGEAGVGKSTLINTYVDWRGQASQYRPSVTQYPELQLYAGPKLLVQELSAPVLRDTSKDAERGLARLWRRPGKQPATTVLLAVDAPSLASARPQALRELAQLVRGKLHILTDGGRRPVCLRVCMTRFDRVEGFSEFARILRQHGHSLRIAGTEDAPLGQSELSASLDPADRHLPFALTTCSTEEYRAVVSFYRRSPALFEALNPLLSCLVGDEAYAPRYPVDSVYLTSNAPERSAATPFAVDHSTIADSITSSQRKVLAACAAALAVAFIGLVALFSWHSARVGGAESQVERFTESAASQPRPVSASGRAPSQDLDALEREARAAIGAMYGSEALWLSHAYVARKQSVTRRFVDGIREAYILPQLDQASNRARLLYAASLLYAARDTELGALVRSDSTRWAEELDIPESAVLDYIEFSNQPWPEHVDLPAGLEEMPGGGVPRDWEDYLTGLERTLAGRTVTAGELRALQGSIPALAAVESYDSLARASRIIARDTRLRVILSPLLDVESSSEWLREHHQSLLALTAEMELASVAVAAAGELGRFTLGELIDELREEAGASDRHAGSTATPSAAAVAGSEADAGSEKAPETTPGAESEEAPEKASGAEPETTSGAESEAKSGTRSTRTKGTYPFALTGRIFTFTAADWRDLLRRSRARILVQEYLRLARGSAQSPFFDQNTLMAPVGGGLGYSQGPTTSIPGQYTRQAFVDSVEPVLSEVQAGLPDVVIDERDSKALERFVLSSTIAYASRYRDALDMYFDSYEFNVSSRQELVYELGAMARSNSWFEQFLLAVATQADPPLQAGELYDPISQSLASFVPLVELMAGADGQYPKLLPYTTVLTDLATALDAQVASDGGADGPTLALDLDAAGVVALEVVQGKAKSRTAEVRAWLSRSNLDGRWSGPFLRPVEQVYELGYENIESALATAWQSTFVARAQRLLRRYPFNPEGSGEVAIADLETWLKPADGTFWVDTAALIEPVTRRKNGTWTMRKPLRAPPGMLRTLERAETLAHTLWSDKGERAAILLEVTPMLLPRDLLQGRIATLSFLKSGSASVYGFNQQPRAQALPLAWWAQEQPAVGVQLRSAGDNRDSIYSLSEQSSTWGFFRLLDQAAAGTLPGTLTWEIPVPKTSGSGVSAANIRYQIASDPRALFTELASAP